MEEYFTDLIHPSIKGHEISVLKASISESEIQRALKELYSGKSPGEDGFSAEFLFLVLKAFERIEWSHIFFAMAKFGFSPILLKWVK